MKDHNSLFRSDIYICVAQNQGLVTTLKKYISALINEKNTSKSRTYLASVDFSILQIAGESGGRQRSHTQKTTFKKKNWQFNHKLVSALLHHMLH